MKRTLTGITFLVARYFTLLLMFVFYFCNGQTKHARAVETFTEQSFTAKSKKLVKTQGTNAYQNVHCIIQDKSGDIWCATTGEGVYRYDGNEFTQFTTKDGLSDNTVWTVLEDATGNIWFGTNDGVSLYNGKTISKVALVTVTSVGLGSATTQSAANAVWSMLEDKNGTIWLGTDNGLLCYDGGKFAYFLASSTILNKDDLSLKSIQCMFQDLRGNIWFGSGPMAFEGICLFDGKSLTNFKPKNEGWIRKITGYKNGTVLFDTRHNGLIAYDGTTFSAPRQPENLGKELLTCVLVDNKGNTWLGSDYKNNNDIASGGLWKFDGQFFTEFTNKNGLNNTTIYSLMEDKKGHVWIGTRNCGLYRYNGQTFENFSE